MSSHLLPLIDFATSRSGSAFLEARQPLGSIARAPPEDARRTSNPHNDQHVICVTAAEAAELPSSTSPPRRALRRTVGRRGLRSLEGSPAGDSQAERHTQRLLSSGNNDGRHNLLWQTASQTYRRAMEADALQSEPPELPSSPHGHMASAPPPEAGRQQQQQHAASLQMDHQGFKHFRSIVEAEERGDMAAASAGFRALNERLNSLPMDSLEKADILAECGLHMLLEARRCSALGKLDQGRTSARRAITCLQTSIRLQRTVCDTVTPTHCLWLGQVFEYLTQDAKALNMYRQGVASALDGSSKDAYALWQAQLDILLRQNDYGACWTALMQALSIWPERGQLLAQAGAVSTRLDAHLSEHEKLSQALIWYDAAAEAEPLNPSYAAAAAAIRSHLALSAPSVHASGLRGQGRVSRLSKASGNTDYGHVLPPEQRQFGQPSAHSSQFLMTHSSDVSSLTTASSQSSLITRPQTAGPPSLPFPPADVPAGVAQAIPDPWSLPTPSLRSRSAVSSPGPSRIVHRKKSSLRKSKGLLHRVQDAVKSMHDVARAVTPLKEKIRETRHSLEQQYNGLEGRVDELSTNCEVQDGRTSRRLSVAETRLSNLEDTLAPLSEPPHAAALTPPAAQPSQGFHSQRPQSVPPQRYDVTNLSQNELLERSIMLYGVWALERRLGVSQ